jgi:hypothetical protein
MAETMVANEKIITPAQTQPAAVPPVVQAPVQKEEDLIKRASQVKLDKQPEKAPAESDNPFGLNRETWDEVQKNPTLKKYYDSMQDGFRKKTTEVSNEKYHLQMEMEKLNNWTPERIQHLLNDPKFVNAAQSIIGTQANDSEYVSEEAKKIKQLENEINSIKGNSFQTLKLQQDEQMKGRYANYNPEAIDIITNDMLTGKVQATREHLWKVLDYDDAVKRAYELGKQDGQGNTKEKISAMSVGDGTSMAVPGEKLEPLQGESDRSYLSRLFQKNSNLQRQAGK